MASSVRNEAMTKAGTACWFPVAGEVGMVAFDYPNGPVVRFLPGPYDTVMRIGVEDARTLVEERLERAIEATGPNRRASKQVQLFTTGKAA